MQAVISRPSLIGRRVTKTDGLRQIHQPCPRPLRYAPRSWCVARVALARGGKKYVRAWLMCGGSSKRRDPRQIAFQAILLCDPRPQIVREAQERDC